MFPEAGAGGRARSASNIFCVTLQFELRSPKPETLPASSNLACSCNTLRQNKRANYCTMTMLLATLTYLEQGFQREMTCWRNNFSQCALLVRPSVTSSKGRTMQTFQLGEHSSPLVQPPRPFPHPWERLGIGNTYPSGEFSWRSLWSVRAKHEQKLTTHDRLLMYDVPVWGSHISPCINLESFAKLDE